MDDLKIRLHGNFALQHGEISTLCGSIEAFRASISLVERLSVEGMEVLRDYVREGSRQQPRGPDRDIRLAFADYIDHVIRDTKERERHLLSGYD
jgi:hypothetical protein